MSRIYSRTSFVILLVVVLVVPLVVTAQTNESTTRENVNRLTNTYRQAQSQETRINALKGLGIEMIDRRLASLNTAVGLLNETEHISELTKASLTTLLNGNISNLTALKGEIQNATELEALKALVRSIVTEYRIYIVVLPKAYGLAAVDRLSIFADKLSELETKVGQKADELSAAGKDVSEITSLVSQAQDKITDANAALDVSETTFNSMAVNDPDGARDLRVTGKRKLSEAREALREARSLLVDAIKAIKDFAKE